MITATRALFPNHSPLSPMESIFLPHSLTPVTLIFYKNMAEDDFRRVLRALRRGGHYPVSDPHSPSEGCTALSRTSAAYPLLPIPYPFSFQILVHSFTLSEITTLLFLSDSTLFRQNTRVWEGGALVDSLSSQRTRSSVAFPALPLRILRSQRPLR